MGNETHDFNKQHGKPWRQIIRLQVWSKQKINKHMLNIFHEERNSVNQCVVNGSF